MARTYEEQVKTFEELNKKKQKLLQEAVEINTRIDLAKDQYDKLSEQAKKQFGTNDPAVILEMADKQQAENEQILTKAEKELEDLASIIYKTKEEMKKIAEA